MAGSIPAAPASNQSSLRLSCFPKLLRAVLNTDSRMWFHMEVALSVGQSSRASSMAFANFTRSSGVAIPAVFIRGRGFCLEQWVRFGSNLTLLTTKEWSVSQSAL